ncbi:MAG: thiamine-phosphate kinase [Moraxellaceae bacterium]|jgi:thiamine-monophosphate kinase|nr:thiamine-phosphate kinase [Moraxellaceae bacterium]
MTQKGEFELIDEFFRRPGADASVRLGIGDDAALVAVPPGHELVVTTDTLVAGRHFPEAAAAYDIGWKALAVNLSDLAAMGAEARWVTLALTLPESDAEFLGEFARGFFALAGREQVSLIGGDTTRGPLTITVTALGIVPQGAALRRRGAAAGDDIYVSGCPGDAGLGLRLELEQWVDELPAAARELALQRLHRPEPRLALGRALRGVASACLDVSDGLAQDLGHLLRASGVGADLELGSFPRSLALAAIDPAFADILALTSGDDYELLFTAPVTARDKIAGLPLRCTPIGSITAGHGLRLLRGGAPVELPVAGFTHF